MRAEEAGVLPHHVHDVRGDDRLVVLPALLLAKPQQILVLDIMLDEIIKFPSFNPSVPDKTKFDKVLGILNNTLFLTQLIFNTFSNTTFSTLFLTQMFQFLISDFNFIFDTKSF